MDFTALVDEITARVAAKLEASPQREAACQEERPKLLVLTQRHGERCHDVLESSTLGQRFQVDCALQQKEAYSLADYAGVILFDLTVDALSKLAAGMSDSPYTALATEAILLGKRLYVPREEVALLRYKQTAPAAYYAMMEKKLSFLEKLGAVLCPISELEATILAHTGAGAPKPACQPSPVPPCPVETMARCERTTEKRVITEKDAIEARMAGADTLIVGRRAIITDLAKDYAKARGLSLVRR